MTPPPNKNTKPRKRKPRKASRPADKTGQVKPYVISMFFSRDLKCPLYLENVKLRCWTPELAKAKRFTLSEARHHADTPYRDVLEVTVNGLCKVVKYPLTDTIMIATRLNSPMLPAPQVAGLLPARAASLQKIVYFEPQDSANPYFPRKIGA